MKKIKNPASFTLPKHILCDWTAFVNVAGFFIMILTCAYCGNQFKTSHSDRKHCSKECMANAYKVSMTGNHNPNWKGGIKPKRKSVKKTPVQRNIIFRKPSTKRICSCGNKKDFKSLVCSECWKKQIADSISPPFQKNCPQCKSGFETKVVAKVYCSTQCRIAFKTENSKGSKNPNWRGGLKSENAKIRSTEEYKKWRITVFERDKYTCVECGIVGGKLNADHIKQFAYHPELRFDITNGRTLCVECHKKTDTYLHKGIQRKIYSA